MNDSVSDSAFPDVRWGSDTSFLRRPATAFAATRLGSWTIRSLAGVDRRLLTRSKGRFTVLGPIGAPTVLLNTVGRKSGQRRTSPLLYVRDADRLVVVGSNFGQQHHPAWTSNLLAQPEASVTMAGRDIPVLATPVTGAEKDRLYRRFVELAGAYAVYRGRTDRDLRMFVLTRR
ncbi:nitroreductase/quinone reductase family protein [Prescottella equi]|jgi:deazaflavin-dependent oxidoreductase (nitroreductase family)|uniref:Nitroreductase family deazaflavin-dependent oxidoreductase n=2 Tax=Rhodococcus hoagii TaxID=43767 RepID=A0AAE4ZHL9_RHOHA|nr:nitroreductase/quinone reductase family protein [Prescottella equi]MBM4469616.1 nitroreductase family deazaflavin-dependent oxidoreductase [Prescottella equi]MBM4472403.1 nitroreductase family deazaflavin-dependent oxidoreductase [Prescottella equi]MBM4472411.1 nitroreductase family deazaflavin-dependent oxidoreductase [Prescottella equi]MBM4472416.1 nitroreductase family deazaflavin-dependent oxidoreductase [Prescottella equi]MBM4474725.1 nitroreductase family deazaflavin-dependent oxidore